MACVNKGPIRNHWDLDVYRLSYEAAMEIFVLSKAFPKEERDSLTGQIRRASRAVCGNLAEAWRKRRYRGAFMVRLTDAEAEAAETQTWLAFSVSCGYAEEGVAKDLSRRYDRVLGMLVTMIRNPTPWLLP